MKERKNEVKKRIKEIKKDLETMKEVLSSAERKRAVPVKKGERTGAKHVESKLRTRMINKCKALKKRKQAATNGKNRAIATLKTCPKTHKKRLETLRSRREKWEKVYKKANDELRDIMKDMTKDEKKRVNEKRKRKGKDKK